MATSNLAWWVGDILKNHTEMAVFGVSAGLGSGKTHGDAQWHHQMVIRNQKCPFSGWMEPTYNLIKIAAIPTYKKVLNAFGYAQGKDYDVFWSPLPRIWYRRSGHEVLFISGDNPENIVAVELSHASVDEAGACPIESTRNFRSRVRHPDAELRQTLMVGAPQGVTGFAEEFDSEVLPDWEEVHWRLHRHTEKNMWRYILWTDDNPYLPDGYIQFLMDTYGHNPNLIKSYRYGLFCPLVTGAAYSNYITQKHDLDPIEADPHATIHLTWDFNANPLAWVSLQKVRFDEGSRRVHRFVAIDEANEGACQLDDAVVEFARKHPISEFRDTHIEVFGDSSGHGGSHKSRYSDYQVIERYLRELGYKNISIRAAKSNPAETASVDAVQRLFMENLLLVSKRCKALKKSLLATTWKEGTRKLNKPNGETWTHHSDALKYFCYQEAREFTGKAIKPSASHIW